MARPAPPVRPSFRTGDGRLFACLAALYWLLLYPILRADRYHDDDLKRSLLGRTGWDSNGRELTTFLMKVLQCYDHALVDISPFTQVAAVAVIAWAGVLIARRFAIRSPAVAALVAFPLGAQPFFLENLSYKFDSLSMALALFLALLPIIGLRTGRRGWWLGVLSLFACLALYQPAINAFLVFMLLEVVLAQAADAPPARLLRGLLARAAQAAVAMGAYQLLLGIHIHGWVEKQGEMIHGLGQLGVVGHNAELFLDYVGGSFNGHWWACFAPLLALLGAVSIATGVRHAVRPRDGRPRWVAAMLVVTSVALPMLMLACVAGPMLLLETPLLMPRVLVGVGPLLSAGLLILREALRAWGRAEAWLLAAAALLAAGMLVVASAYGNAAASQKAYEDRTASVFADTVETLRSAQTVDSFLVDGTIGLSPLATHVATQFPLVGRLLLPYLDGDDDFVTRNFLRLYLPELVRTNRLYGDMDAGKAALARTCFVPPVRAGDRYDIFLVGTTVMLAFHDAHAARCRNIGAGADRIGAAPRKPWP